jgi:hypothetical protein
MAPEFGDGAIAVHGRDDIVSLEAPLQLRQQPGVILDDQEFSVLFGQLGPCTPKRRRSCGFRVPLYTLNPERNVATFGVTIGGFQSPPQSALGRCGRC